MKNVQILYEDRITKVLETLIVPDWDSDKMDVWGAIARYDKKHGTGYYTYIEDGAIVSLTIIE